MELGPARKAAEGVDTSKALDAQLRRAEPQARSSCVLARNCRLHKVHEQGTVIRMPCWL